jgi:hypothetical protein
MKKITLVYGLIAGAIMAIMFLITAGFRDQIGFDNGALIGYTTMVIAFALIFFGIRNYKQNIGNGTISFGRALSIGLLISLVASVIYALSWMLIHKFMMPDFYEKYAAYEKASLQAENASPEKLQALQQSMEGMMKMVANPVFEFLFTLIEPLPVGIIISFVSALILKKKAVVPAS